MGGLVLRLTRHVGAAHRTRGLATVTVRHPAACPATARVQLLADALAA